MRDGVIADFEVAEEMIKRFIQKVQVRRAFVVAPHHHLRAELGATSGGAPRDPPVGPRWPVRARST
jgi:hypothetical protein